MPADSLAENAKQGIKMRENQKQKATPCSRAYSASTIQDESVMQSGPVDLPVVDNSHWTTRESISGKWRILGF